LILKSARNFRLPDRRRRRLMKNEIRSILLVALEKRETDVDYVQGEYTLSLNTDDLELYVSEKLIARYTFSSKVLFTADWDYKKENRYLGYLLEQNGFEVHADAFLLK
jgi:hypothetical protein